YYQRPFGFRRLAKDLDQILGPDGSQNMVFVSEHFNTADELAFYENAPDRTLCMSPDPNQFDFWNPPQKFIGKDAIYVATDKYPRDPRTYFPPGTFESITKLPSLRIYRNGRLARVFYIYRMKRFLKDPWPKKR
ncbi:family 39, partial [mine drainage metagenome]